jgi:hypothetical protein
MCSANTATGPRPLHCKLDQARHGSERAISAAWRCCCAAIKVGAAVGASLRLAEEFSTERNPGPYLAGDISQIRSRRWRSTLSPLRRFRDSFRVETARKQGSRNSEIAVFRPIDVGARMRQCTNRSGPPRMEQRHRRDVKPRLIPGSVQGPTCRSYTSALVGALGREAEHVIAGCRRDPWRSCPRNMACVLASPSREGRRSRSSRRIPTSARQTRRRSPRARRAAERLKGRRKEPSRDSARRRRG